MNRQKLVAFLSLLVLVVVFTACGDKPEPKPEPGAEAAGDPAPGKEPAAEPPAVFTPPVYATPEECFTAFSEAEQHGDAVKTYYCQSLTERRRSLGLLAENLRALSILGKNMPGGRERAKKAAKLLEKHGLGKEAFKTTIQGVSPLDAGFKAALEELGAQVADPLLFLTDTQALTNKGKKKPEELSPEMKELARKAMPRLVEVEIDGDTATGKLKVFETTMSTPLDFVKEDGSWRIGTKPQ